MCLKERVFNPLTISISPIKAPSAKAVTLPSHLESSLYIATELFPDNKLDSVIFSFKVLQFLLFAYQTNSNIQT
jgi:hypothetical protein